MGDGKSSSAWLGSNGTLQPLWSQSGLAAVNLFYSRITEVLGFTPLRHEGKITGLAAYAAPPTPLMKLFRTQIQFSRGSFKRMSVFQPAEKTDYFWGQLTKYTREEIAAAAQNILEEVTLDFVKHWVAQTKCGDVALAGGVFANVKLNQRIAELPEVNSIWVVPHMGDGGLSVGSALGFQKAPPKQVSTVYLGPDYDSNDAYRALTSGESRKAACKWWGCCTV
jgi:carbamoyltransferase